MVFFILLMVWWFSRPAPVIIPFVIVSLNGLLRVASRVMPLEAVASRVVPIMVVTPPILCFMRDADLPLKLVMFGLF